MAKTIFAKGTLLIPSGPSLDPEKKHLFVICNDTCKDGMNLLVPITSWTNKLCDGTCILLATDHNFIKHKSYVFYRQTRLEKSAYLAKGIQDGTFNERDSFSAFKFLKIRNGIITSPQTPRKYKNYARGVMDLSHL